MSALIAPPRPVRRSARLGVLLSLIAVLLAGGCDWLPPPGGTHPGDLPPDLREAFLHPGTWAFDESIGLTCRDGSTTGIGIRLQRSNERPRRGGRFNPDNYSDDLVVFLEGGGACFNFPTCSQNRANFSRDEFFSADFVPGYSGIFDTENEGNPVRHWTQIYVPYCTGDEHVGSTESGTVPRLDVDFDGQPDLPGLPDQSFVGYDNISDVLNYIERYLGTEHDRILLTGASAGGVGALGNYRQVAEAFPHSDVILLDDSGPIYFDDAILPVELQELWRTTWGIDEALPPGSSGQIDVFEDIYGSLTASYPDASLGLISTEQDATIRFFYSFGQALTDPGCAQVLYGGLLATPPVRNACIDGAAYEDALYQLRSDLPAGWRTFYTSTPDVDEHTFLRDDRFYQSTAAGQSLSAWTADLIDGTAQNRGSRPSP